MPPQTRRSADGGWGNDGGSGGGGGGDGAGDNGSSGGGGAAANVPPQAALAPPLTRPPAGAGADGTYAGSICLSQVPTEAARCYRAQGDLAQSELTGEVDPTGEASIELRAEDGDGTVRRNSRVTLTGKLQNGRLEANGTYDTGRTATLTWTRN